MNEEESEYEEVPAVPSHRQTSWPKVIGIIAIVFGAFGAFGGFVGIISSFFTEILAKMSSLPADFYEPWRMTMLGNAIGALFLGTLLLFGGILLLKRKPSASMILKSWAVLKILYGGFSGYFNLQMQKAQMPVMMEQQRKIMEQAGGGGAPGMDQVSDMMSGFMDIAMLISFALGLAWVMVLPVFILIWFLRSKISEEVAEWGGG